MLAILRTSIKGNHSKEPQKVGFVGPQMKTSSPQGCRACPIRAFSPRRALSGCPRKHTCCRTLGRHWVPTAINKDYLDAEGEGTRPRDSGMGLGSLRQGAYCLGRALYSSICFFASKNCDKALFIRGLRFLLWGLLLNIRMIEIKKISSWFLYIYIHTHIDICMCVFGGGIQPRQTLSATMEALEVAASAGTKTSLQGSGFRNTFRV